MTAVDTLRTTRTGLWTPSLEALPGPAAQEVAAAVDTALTASARRWTGSSTVRFVSDTSVISRWSDAKG